MPKFSIKILSKQPVRQVNGISFLLHHHVGINLRGVDVGVSKKFARCVQVAASSECYRGESMAARMERDRLGDSSILSQVLTNYLLGYIPGDENETIAQLLEMGWDKIFECRISKINPDAHYENQIRLTIKIVRNEK